MQNRYNYYALSFLKQIKPIKLTNGIIWFTILRIIYNIFNLCYIWGMGR